MDKILKNKKTFVLFLTPALLVFILTVLVPIVFSLFYSFFRWDSIHPMEFVGLENFEKLFCRDEVFWVSVKNNLIYTFICVASKSIGGMLLALLLVEQKRGRELFKTLYFIPAILSSVVVTQLFQQIYAYDPEGLVNAVLRILGLGDYAQAWLSQMDSVLAWISVVDYFKYSPIYIIIFYSALISIPGDVIEAARIDGASGFRMFFRIKFPLIRSPFVAGVVMMLAGTLKEFDIPYLLTAGGPGHASEMVTTHMYKIAFSSLQYGYGSAIAFFIAIECLVIVSLFQKVILRKED